MRSRATVVNRSSVDERTGIRAQIERSRYCCFIQTAIYVYASSATALHARRRCVHAVVREILDPTVNQINRSGMFYRNEYPGRAIPPSTPIRTVDIYKSRFAVSFARVRRNPSSVGDTAECDVTKR